MLVIKRPVAPELDVADFCACHLAPWQDVRMMLELREEHDQLRLSCVYLVQHGRKLVGSAGGA